MSATSDLVNGVSLREAIVAALKRKGAWRDDEIHQRDTLKMALRTTAVATEIKRGGYPGTEQDIALAMTGMAQTDASLRPFATYVGACWPITWNAHEWSLPPVAE